MLLAAVIRLRQIAPGSVPHYLGRAAHACFFELLSGADESLAAMLHDTDGPKGFTVSDLGRPPSERDPAVREWRITSIDPQLTTVLTERVLPTLPEQLQLGGQAFAVEGVITDQAAHPLAGTADPAALAAARLFSGPTPQPRLGLVFRSPTTFRSGGHNVPLPLPPLVFGGYVDRWNAHMPSQFSSPDVRRFADECVVVSRYELATRLVQVEPGAGQVGFTGPCTFTVLQRDNYWLRLFHLLADFAFWCGTGYKTTMGLGQTLRNE
jgi:CRISPR-associated endoribonuclease Cas6